MNVDELIKNANGTYRTKDGKVTLIKDGNEEFLRIESDLLLNPVFPLSQKEFKKPAKAVVMDLDGTTLYSEEFWVYIIEKTVKAVMGDDKFSLSEEDVPHVSGHTTAEHLEYCLNKYCPEKSLDEAISIYHKISEFELGEISNGRGMLSAFRPAEGLKDFLLTLKSHGVKIGLATSGLIYKCVPEIIAVFKNIGLGDPKRFYDSIITGGVRKDVQEFGTLGELAAKPLPYLYRELATLGLHEYDETKVIGIEDSSAGITALRTAGYHAIGVNGGNIHDNGFDCFCDKKVDKLCDALDYIL